jgi:predicted dehydrogenase
MMPKIGIVGAGNMASYHYAGFVKAGADVLCIADMDIAKAKAFASERRIGRVYKTLTEMLQCKSRLDAIS